jgi:hypothetical protein
MHIVMAICQTQGARAARKTLRAAVACSGSPGIFKAEHQGKGVFYSAANMFEHIAESANGMDA